MKLTRIQEITNQIASLVQEMEDLQEKCSHPGATKIAQGDEGNIMTGRDASYWYDCECHLCFKRWRQPQ